MLSNISILDFDSKKKLVSVTTRVTDNFSFWNVPEWTCVYVIYVRTSALFTLIFHCISISGQIFFLKLSR